MKKSRTDARDTTDLPLPARALIDMALAFANQDAGATAEDAEQLAWLPLHIDYVRIGNASEVELERLHHTRLTVRHALRHIAEGKNLPKKLASKIASLVRNATARLNYNRTSGLRTVYTFQNRVEIGTALGVVLVENSALAVRLRQCACEAFFLAEGRRTAAQYCSRSCAKDAARQKSAARQARYREKLKREKVTKRRK